MAWACNEELVIGKTYNQLFSFSILQNPTIMIGYVCKEERHETCRRA